MILERLQQHCSLSPGSVSPRQAQPWRGVVVGAGGVVVGAGGVVVGAGGVVVGAGGVVGGNVGGAVVGIKSMQMYL